MERCRTCEAPLSTNEIAAYLKMVDRGAESFLCKSCLARYLGTTEEEIDRKSSEKRAFMDEHLTVR